jgi:hypothetical protein
MFLRRDLTSDRVRRPEDGCLMAVSGRGLLVLNYVERNMRKMSATIVKKRETKQPNRWKQTNASKSLTLKIGRRHSY